MKNNNDITLEEAQQFINKNLDNSDRLLKKWPLQLRWKWSLCWSLVEDHKRQLAAGLIGNTPKVMGRIGSRGYVAKGRQI